MCRSTPPINICPLVGLVRPVNTPNNVDLPAPDGPTMAVNVRGPSEKETSFRSNRSPISKLISFATTGVPSMPSRICRPS